MGGFTLSKNALDELPKKEFEDGDITETALFGDVRYVMPALDTNPDSILFLTVPLPALVKRINKRGHTEEEAEMGLYVITSDREIFPCKTKYFTEKGVIALIPKLTIRQRWQARRIHEYLNGKAKEVNPFEVFQAVKDKENYYMDLAGNECADDFISCWAIGTYFYFLFVYFPYLKIGGITGVGKTKQGSILASICFNGQISASETAATIFRFVQDTRGSMFIDEQEHLSYKSEEFQAYRQILLSGFQRDGTAHRTNKDTMKIEPYSTYGPKGIIAIAGLEAVLGQRAFETILQKSTSAAVMAREPRTDSAEWAEIRNSLYLLLMTKWKEVKRIYEDLERDNEFTGRLWDLAKPVITIAKFIDEYAPEGKKTLAENIRKFIHKELNRKAQELNESDAAEVLEALKEILKQKTEHEEYRHTIEVYDIRKKVQEIEELQELPRAKHVTRILKNLHLYKNPRRSGKKGGYGFDISKKDLEDTLKRLGITELTESTESSEGKSRTDRTSGKASEQSLDNINGSLPSSEGSGSSGSSVNKDRVLNLPLKAPMKCPEHPENGTYPTQRAWDRHLKERHEETPAEELKNQTLEALSRLEQMDPEG